MLGHEIHFRYCRSTSGELPCRRIRDCWFETIAIDDYIQEFFSEEQIQHLQLTLPPKTIQLVHLIRQAQKMK